MFVEIINEIKEYKNQRKYNWYMIALEIRMARMRTKNLDTKQRNCKIIYIYRYLWY